MKIRKPVAIACATLMASAAFSLNQRFEAHSPAAIPVAQAGLPRGATRCDLSLPLQVEFSALSEPAVGRTTRFEVEAETALDPDLIRSSWIEYDIPSRMRTLPDRAEKRQMLGQTGRGRTVLDVVIPDESRYEIRARLVVELISGGILSRTAVRWIDLGEEDVPPGMIARTFNPDGTGIRIYRGITERR
jgi:hypothetical protein